jgi:hypothetical protein
MNDQMLATLPLPMRANESWNKLVSNDINNLMTSADMVKQI